MYRQESLERAFFKRRAKTAFTVENARPIRPLSGPSSADHARWLGQQRGRLAKSRQSSLRNLNRNEINVTRGMCRYTPESAWSEGSDGDKSLFEEFMLQKATRRKIARERFIHAVKMVIILSRVSAVALEKRIERKTPSRQEMTFTEMADEFQSEILRNAGLTFDRRYFKASRELEVSHEVKTILSSPPEYRTPNQIQTAVYGLQSMTSFAEYPLHMQEKLVKVAWYERVPPKRVIIRQGHYAENFYFVISGSVIVTVLEENPATSEHHSRTAAVLRRGSSFGELALLHHSQRTATVSSQGSVQLLAIGREDFFDIFMRVQDSDEEPQHIAFIRQLPFMKDWPVDELRKRPEMCLFHFYKRGQIVARDSNNSDWIYVVKSGSCQVIRQLTSVKPNKRRIKPKQKPPSTYAVTAFPPVKRNRQRKSSSSCTQIVLINGNKESKDGLHIQTFPTGSDRSVNASAPFGGTSSSSTHSALPDISDMNSIEKTSTSTSSLPNIGNMHLNHEGQPSTGTRDRVHQPKPRITISHQDFHTTGDPTVQSKRAPHCQPYNQDEHTFVQVESLQSRDVFGLSTLNIDLGISHEQASVSLVSLGAELIMVHKECFIRHVNPMVHRNLLSLVQPYPTTKTLQRNLQDSANWIKYKQDLVDDLLAEKINTDDYRLLMKLTRR